METSESTSLIWLINATVPALNDWFIASNLKYPKQEPTQPALFPHHHRDPADLQIRISNLTHFTVELSVSNPLALRDIFATGTYGNSAAIMSEIFDLANATAQPLVDIANVSFSISFQPQPQVVIRESAVSNGGVGNSLGLTASDGNLFNLLVSVSWDNAKDDTRPS
jgi:hypothetical protein